MFWLVFSMLLFFCKQKTAYEMRISDWSSDVCSSDLTIAMTGQSLVNRVVGYFENHVVQTRSVIGVADIHAGPFAHCIQALEDLDAVCAICILLRFFSHAKPIGKTAQKPKP